MFGSILIFIHVFVCLIIIGLVLLQQGKGANLGASFGGGGDSFFGATGADNIMTRITTIAAICFMATSLTLAMYHRSNAISVESSLINAAPEAQPAKPEAAPETSPEAVPGNSDSPKSEEGAAKELPAETSSQSATSSPAQQPSVETQPTPVATQPASQAAPIVATPAEPANTPSTGSQPIPAVENK